MKKLMLCSLFVLTTASFIQAQSCNANSSCCSAGAKTLSKTAVSKLVKQKYATAQINKINQYNDYYRADLTASNRKSQVYYSNRGKWQSTRVYLTKNELPAKAQKVLKEQKQWKKVKKVYKMVYPTRPAGYVAKTKKGKRIDFNFAGTYLTSNKCGVSRCATDSKCEVSKCASDKCSTSCTDDQ